MAIQYYKSGVMQVTGTTGAVALEDLMNTAAAGKGTAARLAGIGYVELQAEVAVRYTVDGQTPTSSVGFIAVANTVYPIETTLDKLIIIGAQKINIAVGNKTLA